MTNGALIVVQSVILAVCSVPFLCPSLLLCYCY